MQILIFMNHENMRFFVHKFSNLDFSNRNSRVKNDFALRHNGKIHNHK